MNSIDILTNMKKTTQLVLLLTLMALAPRAFATTYYVDYTNGSDSNNGTSKATPWQHAPGMNGASGKAASTPINPGDSVILKGCVTWPNVVFSWYPQFGGSPGNPVYVGVDQTWWDNTVSGCSTAWNRPIMDAQGEATPRPGGFLNAMLDCRDNACHDIHFDNIEWKGLLGIPGPVNNQSQFFNLGSQSMNNIYDHFYVHGWVSPYFCVGTGNIAPNSTTITDFVPASYTPCTGITTWGGSGVPVQAYVLNPSGWWGVQGNGPSVTSLITGSNFYTVATNAALTNSGTCKGCTIQIGTDFTFVFQGVESVISGSVIQNTVIDGSDTFEAQLNPYTDCGLTEGDDKWCGASGFGGNGIAVIWRDNVIRYVQTGFQGRCIEWSGNLIEDIRFSTDPSAHTNAVECLDSAPVNGVLLKYGNVFRHFNVANPKAQFGRTASIGLPVEATPQGASTVEYDFNNIAYDTLENSWLDAHVNGTMGSWVAFNNSSDCGPSWNHSLACVSPCPSAFVSCTMKNNHWVTNAADQFAGYGKGSNCIVSNEVVQTVAAANAQGYSESEPFAYSPGPKASSTVGKGISAASICAAISAANPTAGAACLSDTPYAVSYNQTNHTVVVPARAPVARQSGATWDVGAYFAGGASGPPPAPPTGLTAVVD